MYLLYTQDKGGGKVDRTKSRHINIKGLRHTSLKNENLDVGGVNELTINHGKMERADTNLTSGVTASVETIVVPKRKANRS